MILMKYKILIISCLILVTALFVFASLLVSIHNNNSYQKDVLRVFPQVRTKDKYRLSFIQIPIQCTSYSLPTYYKNIALSKDTICFIDSQSHAVIYNIHSNKIIELSDLYSDTIMSISVEEGYIFTCNDTYWVLVTKDMRMIHVIDMTGAIVDSIHAPHGIISEVLDIGYYSIFVECIVNSDYIYNVRFIYNIASSSVNTIWYNITALPSMLDRHVESRDISSVVYMRLTGMYLGMKFRNELLYYNKHGLSRHKTNINDAAVSIGYDAINEEIGVLTVKGVFYLLDKKGKTKYKHTLGMTIVELSDCSVSRAYDDNWLIVDAKNNVYKVNTSNSDIVKWYVKDLMWAGIVINGNICAVSKTGEVYQSIDNELKLNIKIPLATGEIIIWVGASEDNILLKCITAHNNCLKSLYVIEKQAINSNGS